jgi:hypothetical protein
MLSGDEAQRIAAHIAKLPGLLRERLLISEAIAPAHLRCPRRVGLGELRTYLYNEADDATGPRNGLNDRSTAGAQGRVSLYGACLRLPRPPVRFQRGGARSLALAHGRPSLGRAAVSRSSRKDLRSLPARGGVYCAGDLSGSLADAGG